MEWMVTPPASVSALVTVALFCARGCGEGGGDEQAPGGGGGRWEGEGSGREEEPIVLSGSS